MSQNLAQRIGQEFKTLRANELSLKADTVTLSNMFEQPSDEIVFKGNLVPEQGSTFSIGNADTRVKDLFLSGSLSIGASGTIDIAGYTFGSTQFKVDNDLRVDGNVTLGDGNDSITVNAGASNNFLINAKNVSLDATGTLTGAKITEAQITDLKAYVTTSSAQALKSSGALTKVGNVMHLNKADGSSETIDLSVYLDDTNLVTSVAGKTGAVTLTKADVGLGNVDNTSDVNKPISTATQAALNAKAAATHTHDADNITSGTLADARLPTRLRGTAASITDWDDAQANGWYMASNAANAPVEGAVWFLGSVENHGAVGWCTQTVHAFSTDAESDTSTYRRDRNNGVWGTWYRLRLSETEQKAVTQAWWNSISVPISKVTNLQSALDAKIANPASGAAGDILYHNGTSYVRLPKGTNGQLLAMVNGLPAWTDPTIW